MAICSWVLKSWPEVHWQPPADDRRWPVFQHMGTHVRADLDEAGRAVGETVWAARLDAGRVFGAAWEWVELRPGVPAIRDPNGFITNGCLVDAEGAAFSESASIVGLNRVAHTIPWQGAVVRVLRGELTQASTQTWLDQVRAEVQRPEVLDFPGLAAALRRQSRAVPQQRKARSSTALVA